MRWRSPSLSIEPGGEERLARQARVLARAGMEAPTETGADERTVVTFQLGGHACAVEAQAIERAVARLGPTVAVPLAAGGQRLVAWVEEQPVPLTDLFTLVGLSARPGLALAHAPALLVSTRAGAVALAVEGPLLLAEDRLAQAVGAALAGHEGLRLVGRLAGGASLIDVGWLLAQVTGEAAG
jgi:chemotaxis signal transduction protein